MAKMPPSASKETKHIAHPEVKGLILFGVGLFLTLSLLSFDGILPSQNWMGLIGYWLSFALTYLLGISSFFLPAFLFWAGWKLLSEENIPSFKSKIIYLSLFVFSLNLLLNLLSESGFPFPAFLTKKTYNESIFFEHPYPHRYTRHNIGGVPIYFLYKDFPTFNLQRMLSDVGIGITFSITLITSFLLLTQIKTFDLLRSFSALLSRIKWKWPIKNELLEKPFESVHSIASSLQLKSPHS